MKKHIWRVNYFFIKRWTKIETSLCFMKRHVWKVSYFFIKRLTKIETSSIFLNSHQKILKNLDFKFSLRKFQNLNFHFMKPYSLNSTIIITTYPCIYLYIQHYCQARWLSNWFKLGFVWVESISIGIKEVTIVKSRQRL